MLPVWLTSLLDQPILGTALKLLVVVGLFVVVRALLGVAARQLERRLQATVPDEDRRNRLTTLLREPARGVGGERRRASASCRFRGCAATIRGACPRSPTSTSTISSGIAEG